MKAAQLIIPFATATLALAGHLPAEQWQHIDVNMYVPPAVSKIIARACSNCHSNDTVWPWYARIGPIGWMLERDVNRARAAMNFSTWAAGPGRNPTVAASTLAAACADIRSDRMPLAPYRLIHPESQLSKADKQLFCDWANRSSRELLSRRLPVAP
jgi:hypothetical protein